ncbi:hypothetical protein [Intestinibacter sp.]|uniref:hypothetical protein n=1 Tax=Intestinibacter sp. TaxID=1965304 RepID=UPI002A747F52|nr:hypothetical protein [Intestinibacter sp.]MDY2736721.1 hypothetical protein [Intestinibacter sp.]
MEKRNVTVTLDKAREWFNSGNESLKEIALQAFNKEELTVFDFTRIKTFEDALTALKYTESTKVYIRNTINDISMYSKASAAMTQLNIVRKALNLGHELPFINYSKDSDIYYPDNTFIAKNSICYNLYKIGVIGEFKYKGEEYCVLNRDVYNGNFGLSNFSLINGIGYADTNFGLLGCASKEIAIHFGKYFGMLITEAKYGDLEDFVIIKKEYEN